MQFAEHFRAVGGDALHLAVKVVEHGLVLLLEIVFACVPRALRAKMLHFEANFRGKRAVERVVGLDNGVAGQCALAKDVGIAKLLFGDRHLLPLIGVPEHLSPVASCGVERAAVVENDSFYRHFFTFLPFYFLPLLLLNLSHKFSCFRCI